MMQKLRYIALLFLLMSTVGAVAQEYTTLIKGRVLDGDSNPMPYVTVMVRDVDFNEKVLAGAVSDTLGLFEIRGSFTGTITVEFMFVNYHDHLCVIRCSEKEEDLGDVEMVSDTRALKAAEVTAERDVQQVAVDKVEVRTDKGAAAVTGSVLDALQNVSSVTIDNQDNISIRGNDKVLILVDGAPTTLGSLASLPASSAEKIEIISSPDASYDAEGSGGVVNIVTNRNYNSPLSGVVAVNYGFNNMVNGNIALHHSGQKFSIGVQYNVKYEEDFIHSDMRREFYSSSNIVEQDIQTLKTVQNHVAGLNMGYKINGRNQLNFNFNYSFLSLINEQGFDNKYFAGNDTLLGHRFNDIGWNRNVFEGNLKYTHQFEKKGSQFSVLAALSQTKGHRPVVYYESGEEVQKSETRGAPLNAALQGDFIIKKPKGSWNAGLKVSYRSNTNQYQFFESIENQWVYSNIFSNDLKHDEIIPALYFMYTPKVEAKFYYKLGLRTEYSYATIESEKEDVRYPKQSFFIAPNVVLGYQLTEKDQIRFMLSRRISRPQYPQLIPYVNMIDDKTYETGNRDLDPEKITKLDLGYRYSGKVVSVTTSCYLDLATNYITQVSTEYQDQQDALLITFVNGDLELKTGLDLNATFKIVKYLNIAIGNNVYYGRTSGNYSDLYNNIDLGTSGWMNNFSATLNILPHRTTKIYLQYFVSSPQFYPQFTTTLGHYMNIGITQNFLKNKLIVSALLTDPFKTNTWNMYSDNPVYYLENNSENRSRMFWLGITYRFNDFVAKEKKAQPSQQREFIFLGD